MSLGVVVGDSLAKSFGLGQVYDVVDATTYIPDDVLMQDLWAATHWLYLGRGSLALLKVVVWRSHMKRLASR